MLRKRDWNELTEGQFDHLKFSCVGLDTEYGKLSTTKLDGTVRRSPLLKSKKILKFNYSLLERDCIGDFTGFYKPNIAFYEAHGARGLDALQKTVKHIQQNFPHIPVILDFKRGDIGNTNFGYVDEAVDYFNADAFTVSPYLGGEALKPFLDRKDKGVFILCKTSNSGSGEFQNLNVEVEWDYQGAEMKFYKPLYEHVAYQVANFWNKNGNCGLVVGATYPKELKKIREIAGDAIPILIPGVGKQGGDLKEAIKAGKNSKNRNFIVNSSSGIIFASDPREEAASFHRNIVSALVS